MAVPPTPGWARTGESGTLLVCLNERFARPGAYEVELGTILRDIVEDLGGGLADGRPLTAVQVGGPLGGFVAPAQFDLPLLDSALAAPVSHSATAAWSRSTSGRRHGRSLTTCGDSAPRRAAGRVRRAARAPGAVRPIPTGATTDDGLLDLMAQASLCAFGRGIPRAVRSLCRAVPMDS